MHGKLLALLVAIVALSFGGQQAYVAFTNRKPLKTTCADYVNSKSSAKWVELSGCTLDYDRAIQLKSRILKDDKGIFIPVRPIGSRDPAPILLHLQKESFDQRLQAFIKAPLFPTLKNGEAIGGLVQFGMDSDSKMEEAITKSSLKGQLAADYKLIESGAKPDMAGGIFGIVLIIAAVIVGSLLLRAKLRLRRITPPPLPPPLP